MKATFNQHIGVFEEAVPKEWCERVINFYNNNSQNHISRYKAEKGTPSIFKSDHHLTHNGDSISHFLKPFEKNFWDNIYPLYNAKYTPDFLEHPKYLSDFKIQKTLPTEGYHMWHCEVDHQYTNRIMAYTLYLNDVEDGGETEFLYQSLRLKPKQGTVVLWPAGYTHMHRGNPPLSGEKYIVTGWVEWT
jgi:hypothetical protein